MPTEPTQRATAGAGVIGAETFMRAQRDAIAHGELTVDEQLTAAGIDHDAAQREATYVVDLIESYGVRGRDAVRAAFLSGLELGARCARLV